MREQRVDELRDLGAQAEQLRAQRVGAVRVVVGVERVLGQLAVAVAVEQEVARRLCERRQLVGDLDADYLLAPVVDEQLDGL